MGKLKDKKTVDELWHQHEAYVRKICNYKLASMSDLIDDNSLCCHPQKQ